MAKASALAQAREHVWRVAVVQVSVCEKGEGERRAVSTAFVDALSCPGRVHAHPSTSWASWVGRMSSAVVLLSDQG
jgi:hypothetical protein